MLLKNQKDMIFYCSDFQVQELIDVRPKENSAYIRSSTEPFDDEMELDQKRVKRWLVHFGLLKKEEDWNSYSCLRARIRRPNKKSNRWK